MNDKPNNEPYQRKSIFNFLNKNNSNENTNPKKRGRKEFEENGEDNDVVYLVMFCHGGLPLEQENGKKREKIHEKTRFKTVQTPVKLHRLIKVAKRTCGYDNKSRRERKARNINQLIDNTDLGFEERIEKIREYMRTDSDNTESYENHRLIELRRGRTKKVKVNNSKIPSQHLQHECSSTTQNCFLNHAHGNRYVINNIGDDVINKNFTCNQTAYEILYLSEDSLKINKEENLMTNKNFKEFIKSRRTDYSLEDINSDKEWPEECIKEINLIDILLFFRGKTVVIIDYSCEVLNNVAKVETEKSIKQYKKMVEEAELNGLHGGKKTKKRSKKKAKMKRRKTSKRKTHKRRRKTSKRKTNKRRRKR